MTSIVKNLSAILKIKNNKNSRHVYENMMKGIFIKLSKVSLDISRSYMKQRQQIKDKRSENRG